MKKATIYLGSNKTGNCDVGREIGLKDEALDAFAYACYEVKADGVVDDKGMFTITHIDDRKVEDKKE